MDGGADLVDHAGFDHLAPAEGAFYLYADVRHMTNDSDSFCRRMLDETGVATTAGVDFDPERGNCFMRFSFAGAEADIAARTYGSTFVTPSGTTTTGPPPAPDMAGKDQAQLRLPGGDVRRGMTPSIVNPGEMGPPR